MAVHSSATVARYNLDLNIMLKIHPSARTLQKYFLCHDKSDEATSDDWMLGGSNRAWLLHHVLPVKFPEASVSIRLAREYMRSGSG